MILFKLCNKIYDCVYFRKFISDKYNYYKVCELIVNEMDRTNYKLSCMNINTTSFVYEEINLLIYMYTSKQDQYT